MADVVDGFGDDGVWFFVMYLVFFSNWIIVFFYMYYI